jgi:hypothetical protein
MKEFIEKLIGRLEEYKKQWMDADYLDGIDEIIEIVNELAEEYINISTDTSTTNADRIRSMSDEELAEFISKYFSCEYECAVRDKCGSDWDCKRATIDWLQSEVEGVTENE